MSGADGWASARPMAAWEGGVGSVECEKLVRRRRQKAGGRGGRDARTARARAVVVAES